MDPPFPTTHHRDVPKLLHGLLKSQAWAEKTKETWQSSLQSLRRHQANVFPGLPALTLHDYRERKKLMLTFIISYFHWQLMENFFFDIAIWNKGKVK